MKARKIPFTTFDELKIKNVSTYRELLRLMLDAPIAGPGRGLSTDEILICVRLAREIKEAPDTGLLLEKKDWDFIVKKLEAFQWPALINQEVSDFIEAIRNAPEVDVGEQ